VQITTAILGAAVGAFIGRKKDMLRYAAWGGGIGFVISMLGGASASIGRTSFRVGAASVLDNQRLLNAAGFPVPLDGVLGPLTRKSIIAFQAANGLSQTGTFDSNTVLYLQSEQLTHQAATNPSSILYGS
jgi:hypothetical protein